MEYAAAFSSLQAFAKKNIDAHRYPNDYHFFTSAKCPACGVVPLELTIEHHSGSKNGNFKGVIFGRCVECRGKARIASQVSIESVCVKRNQYASVEVCTFWLESANG